MIRHRFVAVLLCAGGLVSACSTTDTAGPTSTPPSVQEASSDVVVTSDLPATSTAAQIPEQDSRAVAASMMMVGVANYDEALWALGLGVGGIFVRSDTDPGIFTQPGRDIAALREAVGREFDVAIDFEGGRVLRHASVFGDFPAPAAMAATMTPEQVRALAAQMGTSLASRGVTTNFAPVVDVDIAGLEVVGDRAFSSDPAVAATYAAAFVAGMQDAGITPVIKHFPGHGRASGDSHTGGVVTPPLADLAATDLPPFGSAIIQGAPAVMVGHLQVPGLGDESLPATLNPAAYDLLRSGDYPGGAPFTGLVYTDDLSGMRAITDNWTVPEAVALALRAGADRALWISPAGLEEAIDRTAAAIDGGVIARP